ncbi:MAG: molybdenum cofactor biosynthesis protein MoaE [Lautropia sp.]|nr:molybdenum cofactor biosynthesis protein MoaE [Lautropia sp.]
MQPVAEPCIRVQSGDFDVGHELACLQQRAGDAGAVASFVGYVRRDAAGHRDAVSGLTLEHYPGMTERALADICQRAMLRWPLLGTTVIHRVGPLASGAQIVLVAVAARHRDAAFEACRFIMDFLKTDAPFWKKEVLASGEERWVDARESDEMARERWC